MAKRTKRAGKSIESLKNEIENHFEKVEDDIKQKNINRGEYHCREIENSFLFALQLKMRILGKIDIELIEEYRKRSEKLKEKINLLKSD